MAGLTFRYHTNRHYYLFAISGGNRARLALHLPLEPKLRVHGWKELADADFPYDTKRYYSLKVAADGPRIRAYIDGKLILEASDSDLLKGKAGVISNGPARFEDFHVLTSDDKAREIANNIRKRDAELARLRNENRKPKLWKKFDTPVFGAGRNVRFGDLDGDAIVDMRSRNREEFPIADSGWPHRESPPVGVDEMPAGDTHRPYEFENGDSIAFLNLSGDKNRHEILVKDRYRHFWIYNNKLELI